MAGTTEERPTYKDVLRYIYDSEECKIDSLQGKQLKQIVERLCLNDDNSNSEFLYLFQTVETDINKIKEQSKCSLFQAMYKYSAETFSDYYEKLEPTTEYRNIVLWQVCCMLSFIITIHNLVYMCTCTDDHRNPVLGSTHQAIKCNVATPVQLKFQVTVNSQLLRKMQFIMQPDMWLGK